MWCVYVNMVSTDALVWNAHWVHRTFVSGTYVSLCEVRVPGDVEVWACDGIFAQHCNGPPITSQPAAQGLGDHTAK